MDKDLNLVYATEDQKEVARKFERYDLFSAPVVDDNDRLLGVITVDDIVEVIQSEADEDMKALGGVGDESLADSVLATSRSRVPWLVVNLGTAVLASSVIGAFDATIEQMVALAVLMPIVASMGGNAGTQTMTVTVRALATRKLGSANAPRIITRETLVGLHQRRDPFRHHGRHCFPVVRIEQARSRHRRRHDRQHAGRRPCRHSHSAGARPHEARPGSGLGRVRDDGDRLRRLLRLPRARDAGPDLTAGRTSLNSLKRARRSAECGCGPRRVVETGRRYVDIDRFGVGPRRRERLIEVSCLWNNQRIVTPRP